MSQLSDERIEQILEEIEAEYTQKFAENASACTQCKTPAAEAQLLPTTDFVPAYYCAGCATAAGLSACGMCGQYDEQSPDSLCGSCRILSIP